MAIPKGHQTNFKTLCQARDARDLCLMECQDRATGRTCYVVCAVNHHGEEVSMIPLARLFDGNPYDVLNPPHPNGGFYNQSESEGIQ